MIWEFIQNQILGMKWMSTLIGNLLEKIGLDTSSRMGGSVQFFLYDVLKITILLCILIFMISYIQSYFPPERSKKIMGCNVGCPFIGRPFDDNWGLDDPTGKDDVDFIKVINQIELKIKNMIDRMK